MNRISEIESTFSNWKTLYRVGGVAALIMAAITVTQSVVFIVSPPPYEGTVVDWFTLFEQNAFLGLLGFEALLIIYVLLAVLVSLALFVMLKKTNPALTAIFLLLSIIGSMAFISARPAFEMLFLSTQYAAATTDAQKAIFLAGGEAMIAIFHGTAFQVSYLLGSLSGLIIAAVMLGSDIFGKAIPYLRIASSVLDFGIFVPTIGLYISLFSVLFLLLFNILVGQKLLRLGKKFSM